MMRCWVCGADVGRGRNRWRLTLQVRGEGRRGRPHRYRGRQVFDILVCTSCLGDDAQHAGHVALMHERALMQQPTTRN